VGTTASCFGLSERGIRCRRVYTGAWHSHDGEPLSKSHRRKWLILDRRSDHTGACISPVSDTAG
jgi:hypothetical protein